MALKLPDNWSKASQQKKSLDRASNSCYAHSEETRMTRIWDRLSGKNRPPMDLVYVDGGTGFCDIWAYGEHADAGQYGRVLRDKWLMLQHYQRGE